MEYSINPINVLSGLKKLQEKGMGREATKSEINGIFDTLQKYYPISSSPLKEIPTPIQHLYWKHPNFKDNVIIFLGQHKYEENTFFARTEDNLCKSIESMPMDNKSSRYRSERGVYSERVVNGCLGHPSLRVPTIGEFPYYYNLSDTSHLNGVLGISNSHTCRNRNPLISGASGMNNDYSRQNNPIYPLYQNQVITSTIFSFDYDSKTNEPKKSSTYKLLCDDNPFLEEFDFIMIIHGVLLKDVYNKNRSSCNVIKNDNRFKAELAPGFYATLVPLNYYLDNLIYLDCSPLHLVNGSSNMNFTRFCAQLLTGFIKNIHNSKVDINGKLQSIYQILGNNTNSFVNLNIIASIMKTFDNKFKFLPTEKTIFRVMLPSEEKYTYHSFICTYDPLENARDIKINSWNTINFEPFLVDYESKRNVEKIYEFIKSYNLDSYLIIGLGFSNIFKLLQSSLDMKATELSKYEMTLYYCDAFDFMINFDNGYFYDYMTEVSSKAKSPHFGPDLTYHFAIETLRPLIDKSLYLSEESVNDVIQSFHNDFNQISKNLDAYLKNVESHKIAPDKELPKFFCATSSLIAWIILTRVLNQGKNLVESSLETYIPPVILTPMGFLNYTKYLNNYVLTGGALHNIEIYDDSIMENIMNMDGIIKDYLENMPIIPKFNCKVDIATITSCGGNISIKEFIENPYVKSAFEEEKQKMKESMKNKVKVQNNLKALDVLPEPSEVSSVASQSDIADNSILTAPRKCVKDVLMEQHNANFFGDTSDLDLPPWEESNTSDNTDNTDNTDNIDNTDNKESDSYDFDFESVVDELAEEPVEIDAKIDDKIDNENKDGCNMNENVISNDISLEKYKLDVIQAANDLGCDVVKHFIDRGAFSLNEYAKFVFSELQNTIQTNPNFIFELSAYIKKYQKDN